ncbi:hypothetical protein OSH08_13830 [Kaistia geumhonensis]|uniref:Uncharacterized protein n=1 Tax=Kaistia geumhonensis TaxID=410839 RepID=A0ABU0M152_9HYPH|nr:hypothetical protein [Kaistia geumhonensis]MCX5480094.1 hypothetical protein [Kaistia geumhonensis]MDQ0514677.1 hypothetical protein [Kaistia geumhonensis]
MMRVALASAVAVVIATGSALAGPAATLSDVSGPVLVDSGKGFQKVSTATEVLPGSRVMVSKGGKAMLAYADGCEKSLAANSITTVVDSGACAQSSQVAAQTPVGLGLTPTMVIGGGVVIGGAAAIIIAASQDDDTPFIPVSQ